MHRPRVQHECQFKFLLTTTRRRIFPPAPSLGGRAKLFASRSRVENRSSSSHRPPRVGVHVGDSLQKNLVVPLTQDALGCPEGTTIGRFQNRSPTARNGLAEIAEVAYRDCRLGVCEGDRAEKITCD